MRVTVQRVKRAACYVDNQMIGAIEQGLMLLIGFKNGDNMSNVDQMAKKIAQLRIFSDENGKMNKDIRQVTGEILAISQFTLYADTSSGNRPSFIGSLEPEKAKELYEKFMANLETEWHLSVAKGIFGADMQLEVVCDGPVTINLEF